MNYEKGKASRAQLLELILFIRAAALAAKGRLGQAEGILLPIIHKSSASTDALDLLAKVYAQQGKLDEARALWVRASGIEPSLTHFQRAISLCDKLQRSGVKRFFIAPLITLKMPTDVQCQKIIQPVRKSLKAVMELRVVAIAIRWLKKATFG